MLIGLGYYAWFRRRHGLPVARSVPHRWEEQQRMILRNAEEYDLLERYEIVLAQRDRDLLRRRQHA